MVFGADTPLRIIRRQVMRLSDALAIESDAPITSAPASQPIETQEATSFPLPLEPAPTIDDVQPIPKDVVETSSQKDNVPPAAQTLPSRPTNFRPPEKLKSTLAPHEEREARAPGTYVGYACFWMLENENRRLDPTLTNALERWIHRTANKHDWDIIGIEIGDSWVNLHIEIPVKEIPSHVIYIFMESTAQHLTELAREDFQINTPIWAPSYTVTTPGRLLESYEIERFMHYYQQQSL
jgi:REP element-mobilizing transposase RayT